MRIIFQKPADAFLVEVMADVIDYFKSNYGDPSTVDRKFFATVAAQAVKSKFITTVKESNRKEMDEVLKSRS